MALPLTPHVVVVGAGLSGLTAAALLTGAGISVTVVEAGPEIGGRIRAVRDAPGGRALADLGPTWIWPRYQPVAAAWVRRLGLATFPQFVDGDGVLDGFGPAPRRQPLPGQDGIARIVGGPVALIEALARQIDPASVRLSSPVVDVTEAGGRVAVTLTGEVAQADRVVLAVPLRGAVGLVQRWATPALLRAMQDIPTWMSQQAKAVALYDRPFWRAQGLSGRVASRVGPLAEVHDHTEASGAPAALFGFVGWPPAARRADPEGLRAAILGQLVRCFGPEAGTPNALVIEDWAANPHICSDLDLRLPPAHPDVGPDILRAAHLDGRLWFAVSETARVSPGLIEGALAAGEASAAAVLQSLQT